MHFRLIWAILICLFLSCAESFSSSAPSPLPTDKCPVCGMFVNKYKDFLSVIELEGGQRLWFDGSKDFFKYYINPASYGENRQPQDFKMVLVTDYYAVQLIDARSAWFVSGSNVFGPMGHELIPFAKEGDAREFMADHGGKRLWGFKEINAELLKGLE